MKTAVFPGSFDPFTLGHYDIVKRSLSLFDKIIIGIGNNSAKNYMFPVEERIQKIQELFKNKDQVTVLSYQGLTADFCKEQDASFIIRGIRNSADYLYEAPISQMNKTMGNHPETIFLASSPEHSAISSTILRDILRHGGDVSAWLPKAVQ